MVTYGPCIKNGNFGHVYRFKGDLMKMNDSKDFENSFKKIYSDKLDLQQIQMIV